MHTKETKIRQEMSGGLLLVEVDRWMEVGEEVEVRVEVVTV